MSKGRSSQVEVTGSFGHLREMFGDDVQTRIDKKEITQQSCIVKGCNSKFWVPYGRHYVEGGDINRGTCNAECERIHKAEHQAQALAEEAAFVARSRVKLVPSREDDPQPQAA